MESDDEDLWVPFLAYRQESPQAARVRKHIAEDVKRGGRVSRRVVSLSRAEIVAAAIRVADAEGADAVSMRRIARELNAGTMSLYWHVVSKEELLDLMIDAIEGEAEVPEPSGDWRQDLTAIAAVTRAALRRHEWAVSFMAGRPPTGPSALRNLERALAALDGLGLDQGTTVTVLLTLATYVRGAVVREFQELTAERYLAEHYAGVTETDRQTVIGEFIGRVRATGRYPHLVAMMEAGVDPDAPETRDARFDFGLDCLLDGVAARIASAGHAKSTGQASPG